PQNDVTLKMPAFEWVHVQLHQQKGMISLSPPTICNSALISALAEASNNLPQLTTLKITTLNFTLYCDAGLPFWT
ncbi:hypothetical protein, partial [Pseudomonas aeruginosa]|uniref:hypothetical protein n=1 Tax=Pseudomonas aeruginosa TaxID=287 RepID=UPI0022B648E5